MSIYMMNALRQRSKYQIKYKMNIDDFGRGPSAMDDNKLKMAFWNLD